MQPQVRCKSVASPDLVYPSFPARFSPLSKDWNQDLQELALEQLRRLVAGAGAIDARTEIATERSPSDEGAEAIPGLAVSSEVCHEADSIERVERVEVGASPIEVPTAPANKAAEHRPPRAHRVTAQPVSLMRCYGSNTGGPRRSGRRARPAPRGRAPVKHSAGRASRASRLRTTSATCASSSTSPWAGCL